MTQKILGAIFIFLACGGMGISIAASHRQKERMLQQIIAAAQFMTCELEYRQTALPQLMEQCAQQTSGVVGHIFQSLSRELQRQIAPDATCCMAAVLDASPKLPAMVLEKMEFLGRTLGRFDLSGQLSGLQALTQLCKRDLDGLLVNREARLRGYMTLGFCAGAALVILFI